MSSETTSRAPSWSSLDWSLHVCCSLQQPPSCLSDLFYCLSCLCLFPSEQHLVFSIYPVPSNLSPYFPPDFQTHNRLAVSQELQIQQTPREFMSRPLPTPMDLPGPDLLGSSCPKSKALCIILWGETYPHSLPG